MLSSNKCLCANVRIPRIPICPLKGPRISGTGLEGIQRMFGRVFGIRCKGIRICSERLLEIKRPMRNL